MWKHRESEAAADSARGEAGLESEAWGFGGLAMHRFIDGEDRMQQTLLPNTLEDYVSERTRFG
jgi:hypothetical protein